MAARRGNPSTKDKEKFKCFLRTLEHKTWHEVLFLVEAEYQSLIGSDQKKYCARLIELVSYLRFPTEEMPKGYESLLSTIPDLPKLLAEKMEKLPEGRKPKKK